jgi:hypothetical protein
MKIKAMVFLFFLPLIANAADLQNMSEENMQLMMQQAQQAAACMQNISEADMKQLEQRATRFEKEVKSLCSSGQREQAQAKAIDFARSFEDDPVMKKINQCNKQMAGFMPEMSYMEVNENSSAHVCDEI